ncbi:MAG TPA: efflux RND transporter periplasmic adaptor subunit [Burkholderiaceae bacterium]|jgi:membrane fusion protein (multidrug efflux system)|nr:efflux RND transporter periplasmic adaptor subunit [Burkholderiaceae bacterium]
MVDRIDKKPPLKKRMTIMLIVVFLLIGGIVGYNMLQAAMLKKMLEGGGGGIPPATVSTMKAQMQDWQDAVGAVGSLRAVRGVDVSTEIAGLVRRVNIVSGADVAPGAVLVELNSDAERAQVETLKVAVELATTTLNRDREQLTVQAVSQATIDNDEADLRSKKAQLAQMQATLEKKTILAPFAGRLGISTIAPGQYLNAGDKIVSLQAIDPIYVDFFLPQQQISRITRKETVIVTTDAWPGREFNGKVSALNSTIDSTTRNIQVEATIVNPDRALLPGMYAKVNVQVGGVQRFITLPQAAVTYNPYGAAVYLAQPADAAKSGGAANSDAAPSLVASQTFVTLGPTRGDQVAIVKGIKEGDTVVTSGQMKLLRPGTPLIVNNSVVPRNDPNPKPQEQ